MRGLFVTGTDTGIGKTVVSAALLTQAAGAHYWKPVQTGIEEDDDAAEVARLTGVAPTEAPAYRLRNPVSPHLAAARAGVRIDLDWLTAWTTEDQHVWVVEGAGGVLVPLNDDTLTVVLIKRLALPALIVARSALGTINHTLLTLEALRSRSITIAGVVMVGEANIDNRTAVEHYGQVKVAEVPRFPILSKEALESWSLPAWIEEHLV